MDQHDEKPTTDAAANSTASVVKQSVRLTKQQAKFRLWQGQALRAETEKLGVGHPKRRQPSLPKLPWNDA